MRVNEKEVVNQRKNKKIVNRDGISEEPDEMMVVFDRERLPSRVTA